MTIEPNVGTIELIMGALSYENLSTALFGKTRRTLLGLFFSHPDESFYLRQITRITGAGQGATQRELKRLTGAGIITRIGRGHQIRYQVNRDCPIFSELINLMAKTAGLADVLRDALAPLKNQVDIAFIYGSQASGTAGNSSDVDLFVVGSIDELELHSAISQAEEHLARSVNYILLNRRELKQRLKEKGGFIDRVFKRQKIFVVGGPADV